MKVTLLLKVISFISAIIAYQTVIIDISIYYNILFISLYIFAILNESYLHIKFPRILVNVVSIILIIMFSYNINMDTVNTIILRCLILLLFIKLITIKESRDYLQIIALVFFLIAGGALISLNIIYVVLSIIVISLSILQLLILSFYHFDKNYYFKNYIFLAVLKNFVVFTILMIPLTIILFMIIPRSNYPFFDILNRQDKALSGFVDTIKLGENSSIYEDDRVAFRAKMPEINNKYLFWRGVELNAFDGKRWTYSQFYENDNEWLNNKRIVKQDIYLQPLGTKYVIGLDKPVKVIYDNDDINLNNHILSLNKKVNKPVHYSIYSVPSEFIYQQNINKKGYTKLPLINKRIVDLAKKLKRKREVETVNNTLEYLMNNGFKYTIEDLSITERPLYDFLFEHKKGNCELFASAFAVIMRLNNIPVKLISGFYGGEYNKYLGYYTVLFKNSHIWSEVWINNRWIRINPSPVVLTTLEHKEYLKHIRMLIDSIQYYWTIYVINYDLEKQLQIFESLRKPFFNTSLKNFVMYFVIFCVVILLLIIAISLKGIKNINRKKTVTLVQLIENIIRKKYCIKRNNMCLYAYINVLPLSLMDKEKLVSIVIKIMSHFYKDTDLTKYEFNNYRKELKFILKD